MAINEHPAIGTVLTCKYEPGFVKPEMVKRRLVVVISPKISIRPGLCTVVPLSRKQPIPQMSYHCQIRLDPPPPEPWGDLPRWVKGDMVAAVGFHRLDFLRLGRDESTDKRIYRYDPIPAEDLRRIRHCVLCSLGLAGLTKHL
jgi:mRNA interferase MazF